MTRRVIGAAFVAFLVVAIAVTPLSATFRPGYFDMRYLDGAGSVLTATLEDQTGLVEGVRIAYGAEPPSTGMTRALIVSWIGGCDNPSLYMRFFAIGERYTLSERTTGEWCQLLFGNVRAFVIALRAPIDAATVDVVHE